MARRGSFRSSTNQIGGRPGHVADERVAGAQDGAIAEGFAVAARHHERRRRWRGGAVSGLRPIRSEEGQATWLMSELLARKMGQSLKDSPSLLATMSGAADGAAGQFPVFDQSPLYLRQTLVFPYTKGMLFQHAVFERDGLAGFGEVFRRPPASTQQILHPEKYFSGVKPTQPELPQPHLPKGYKSLVGGSLGELEHAIMLEQYSGKERAAELAPHWRGCAFDLEENKKAGRVVLLYAVEWDSEDAARQYFTAYRAQLAKKWKQMTFVRQPSNAVTGTGDDGRFELRRKGAVVTSMEGLPAALD